MTDNFTYLQAAIMGNALRCAAGVQAVSIDSRGHGRWDANIARSVASTYLYVLGDSSTGCGAAAATARAFYSCNAARLPATCVVQSHVASAVTAASPAHSAFLSPLQPAHV
jgi:hypothetical protein